MPKSKLNLVLQKEYLIIEPTDLRPLIGTESLRSCCGIFIFHPLRSAVLHWDDNCRHEDLDRFVKEYLNDTIALEDCRVTLIGGWDDHLESKKSSDFVKHYFDSTSAKLNLTYFQQKKSIGSLSKQGFSLVYMDARTGTLTVSDDWSKKPSLNDNRFRGAEPMVRNSDRELQDLLHLQNDNFPNSGTSIYARDSYQEIHHKQSTQLCLAAKENDIPRLIKLIDEGITSINEVPPTAKGWTPLHFACKLGHFEAALLLIQSGANLFQKNQVGNTPLAFIDPNSFEYKKLLTTYRLVKYNTTMNPQSLRSISLFARHHEKEIDTATRKQLENVQELLTTADGLSTIAKMLPS